jgi:tRNA pseudouridine55 synthase
LCSDLGKILGVGGHMHALRRLSIGDFDIESALSIDNITADSVVAQLVPASDAVSFLPMRLLSDTEKDDVLHGRSLPLDAQSNSPNNPDLVRLVAGGELVALAVPDRLHLVLSPRKVLIPSK